MKLDPNQRLYEEVNAKVTYSSGWSRAFNDMYHGSAIQRTWKIGEWASFKFNGSGIAFLGAQGWDHGSFEVDLDSDTYVRDGSCCVSYNGGYPQVIQFSADDLDRSEHTIRITNLSPGPKGSVLEVDAFIVRQHRPQPLGFPANLACDETYIALTIFFMFLLPILFFRWLFRRSKLNLEEAGRTLDLAPLLDTADEDLGPVRNGFFTPLSDPPPTYGAGTQLPVDGQRSVRLEGGDDLCRSECERDPINSLTFVVASPSQLVNERRFVKVDDSDVEIRYVEEEDCHL